MMANVVKQGFLVKKGHMRHNWRTRWFVLSRSDLSYFKKREDTTPAGVVPLVGASLECKPPEALKKQWIMQLTTHSGKEYLIQAPDLASRDNWKQNIEECIRRLDPSKIGTIQSLTRTLSNPTSVKTSAYREIVQAMQDASAGVKVYHFKAKGMRQETHYFIGSEAVDWLVSWSFVNTRTDGITMATSMLRHGFFTPIHIQYEEGKMSAISDSVMGREFVDTEDAKYSFVAFSPGRATSLFDSDEDISSDSDDDILSRAQSFNEVDTSYVRIIKQGFLLKKGSLRTNWKARKFVLKEKCPRLYYYRGSKSKKPLGAIPLTGLTVLELDDKDWKESQEDRQHTGSRLVLISARGTRKVLEAVTVEERDSWVTHLRVAIASLDVPT